MHNRTTAANMFFSFAPLQVGLRLAGAAVFLILTTVGLDHYQSGDTLPSDQKIIVATTVMAYGDSLTAGYGLPTGQGFVPQLEAWLKARAVQPIRVVNAGVSGDTTAGGRARLSWSLQGTEPDLVILELGANDGLRGIDPALTRDNLEAMIIAFKERDIPVLLVGMMAPPNLGADYGAAFNQIFPDLAEQYQLPFYPFFLEGVAANPALNQADGIHPTQEGVAVIVARLGPLVLDLLQKDLLQKP